MRLALALLLSLLAGCTPALVRTCPMQAVRYSDETTVKLRDRGEMTYRVEWSCVPAATIERSK
jgi:hypothetical protein